MHRGEILGIAGLIGAGRTELLRAIFGLDPVQSGRIRVGAYTGAGWPELRWAQGVGMVSEDRKGEGIAMGLDVADNLTLTRLSGMGPGSLVLPRQQRSVAAEWIARLGIKCRDPRQAVGELSGGNQQKVALARLLHHDVDVLLLDEPTRGIDIKSKAQFYQTIDALVAASQRDERKPRAVLFVSSQLPELIGLCDRIAVMHRGRLGEPRPATEWDEHVRCLRPREPRPRHDASSAGRHRRPRAGPGVRGRDLGILIGTTFFYPSNLELIARQTAIVCAAALGMTVVIVSGGIDLSVGSVVALTTVIVALLLGRDGRPRLRPWARLPRQPCAASPTDRSLPAYE